MNEHEILEQHISTMMAWAPGVIHGFGVIFLFIAFMLWITSYLKKTATPKRATIGLGVVGSLLIALSQSWILYCDNLSASLAECYLHVVCDADIGQR